MIRKQPPMNNGHMKVAFELEQPEAHSVQLAGDFNGWTERVPMQRTDDGTWRAELDLPTQHAYQFRYVVDDQWVNDPQADAYSPNPFGSENCVLRT